MNFVNPVGNLPAAMDFRDEHQCLSVLARLPLTNVPVAHQTLMALVGGMEYQSPEPLAYLRLLETARSALEFVQEEMANHYSARSCPPASPEDEILLRVVSLWQAFSRAYARVAQVGAGEEEVQAYIALICQRCIHYSSQVVIEYFRARREVPPGMWADVNGYFGTAEELGLAVVNVAGGADGKVRHESCNASFAALILIELANPYCRNQREFTWICRWAQRFARLASIIPVAADVQAMHGIDLMQDRGPQPLRFLQATPTLRQVDTAPLKKFLLQVIDRLRQGTDPLALGLGKDCVMPATGRVLSGLFRIWCLALHQRRFPRRPATGTVELCAGFERIHVLVAGTEFIQPEHVSTYSRKDMDSLATFGERVDPSVPLYLRAAQLGFAGEPWEVVDESVSGFRLRRQNPGARLSFGDLIGLKPPDGGRAMLCRISWLMYENDGSLVAGLFILPGSPEAVGVRSVGIAVSKQEKYSPAFLLPPVAALKELPSLVLPRGWFQPEKVVEVYTDRRAEVKLVAVVGTGMDFERVSFIPL